MVKIHAAIFAVTFALSITGSANGIEIDIERGNATSVIRVSGPFEPGDADRFKAYWAEEAYDAWNFRVALDSPGGSLIDGLEIGRFLREKNADTEVQAYLAVPGQFYDDRVPGGACYSACALAFMGGVERSVGEGSSIGFHQFSGGAGGTAAEALERGQYVAAIVNNYLREMGAAPELFEIMSMNAPTEMFVPEQEELVALGIIPSSSFRDFRLMPKDGQIVATATNERNPGSHEKVFEIETLCWEDLPVVNLYAETAEDGLSDDQKTWVEEVGGFNIQTGFGKFEFGRERTVLYARSRILASLVLDRQTARYLGNGSSWIRVNGGMTAIGVFMTGEITAPPGGDPAILASFRDCI